MFFNSFTYIFVFFPLVVAIYFLLNGSGRHKVARVWLIVASLFFLGWNSLTSVFMLLFSALINFMVGLLLSGREKAKAGDFPTPAGATEKKHWADTFRKWILLAGIVFNILLLGFFKYSNFFISNLNAIGNAHIKLLQLGIPLAISFYTFQQLAYLVDTYRGQVRERDFLNYCLFIFFFPRLLMGPICRYQELMPQFSATEKTPNYENMSMGLYIFFIGLCKRVVVADTFGIYVDYGFSSPAPLTFVEGWITSLSYTFQIYFDFSGYTDMAIGSAYFFNIKLPFNFNSPYLSLNIRDFWRRWHITLSAFLKDYIYIPLGGSRKGEIVTAMNILFTFLLAGLWHGAGWTFIVWGGLHGLALIVNRAWHKLNFRMYKPVALLLTFSFLNIAWVFFRASDMDSAFNILKAMTGMNGFWGVITFGSIEFLDKVTGMIIALISIATVFIAKNTNFIPERFHPSGRQLAATVAVILLGLFYLNSVLPKGFLYIDF